MESQIFLSRSDKICKQESWILTYICSVLDNLAFEINKINVYYYPELST